MATTESDQRHPSLFSIPEIPDIELPQWLARRPDWLRTGGYLVLLMAVSAYIRTRYTSGQLWSDEANSVGIATHSLTSIPGILWQGGGAPLYFMLLHVWMEIFGSGVIAVHALSVTIGLITIPVAMWAAWSLWGRRAGFLAATLFGFDAYLTIYADQVRPYELVALLGLLATAFFLHAFVYGRRGYLAPFSVSLAAMLYTDAWTFFFAAGVLVAIAVLWWQSDDRRTLQRDVLITFGAAGVAYLPWLPTLIHQAATATDPWHYIPLIGANFPRDLLGSDRVDALFAVAIVIGLLPLARRAQRRSPMARAALVMAIIPCAAAALAIAATLITPDWAGRYFGPIVASMALLCVLACDRSGVVGLVAIAGTCVFLANAHSFNLVYPSDMSDVSAQLRGYLSPGDMILMAQPEQTPLAYYYFPAGLTYASPLGIDTHPTYMDWDDVGAQLASNNYITQIESALNSLKPGTRVVYVRPLTDGERAWTHNWSMLIRRRAAQIGRLIEDDRSLVAIPNATAPYNYRGACCVASEAYVFVKR